MRNSLMAGAASFAHLLGRGPTRAANGSEEDEEACARLANESDEDWQKRKDAAAEEDKKKDDETEEEHEARVKSNKAKRAQEAEDSEKEAAAAAAAGDKEPDGDEEGDDKSDVEDQKKQGVRSARLRERARCSAIFADAAAGKNPALAATLAFSTDLPRGQAVKVLRAGGLAVASTPRGMLTTRMAGVVVPPVGQGDPGAPAGSGAMTKAARDAAAVIEAGRKRRGEI